MHAPVETLERLCVGRFRQEGNQDPGDGGDRYDLIEGFRETDVRGEVETAADGKGRHHRGNLAPGIDPPPVPAQDQDEPQPGAASMMKAQAPEIVSMIDVT